MWVMGIGLAGGALALWALFQFFRSEDERAKIFWGPAGRLFNIAAILTGSGAVYWVFNLSRTPPPS